VHKLFSAGKAAIKIGSVAGALILPTAALSTTFNGVDYANRLEAGYDSLDYFITHPTRVGETTDFKFYIDFCNWDGYVFCGLSGDPDWFYPAGDYGLKLDGTSGPAPNLQTYFFTLSFAPTVFATPDDEDDTYYQHGAATLYLSFIWEDEISGNDVPFVRYIEGTILAPVPLPATFPLLGSILAAMFALRLRSKKSGNETGKWEPTPVA
jgi:hypothetical protein